MRDPVKTEILLGGLTFGFTANPVLSKDGERLGTVVEWVDRTIELAMESELESIVGAARAGELSERKDGRQDRFLQNTSHWASTRFWMTFRASFTMYRIPRLDVQV